MGPIGLVMLTLGGLLNYARKRLGPPEPQLPNLYITMDPPYL